MKTEETNDGRQSVAVGKDTKKLNLPDAGYKGVDPHDSVYQCPVQCEGSTTYDQPLNCPVCSKKLLLVIS